MFVDFLFDKVFKDRNGDWSQRGDGTYVYDRDVAKFAFKHTRFRDFFNPITFTNNIFRAHFILMQPEDAGDLMEDGKW